MQLTTRASKDYELLDSGEGHKLERFGDIVLARPDPEALWHKSAPELWKKADGSFTRKGKTGSWKLRKDFPASWNIKLADLTFKMMPTSFKHVGVFPEQQENWKWIEAQIKKSKLSAPKILNLFAYTGGATLAALRAGAEVVHVDGSKAAISWARENAELCGLSSATARWILDDVISFLKREVRRGNTYDAIIMDPPAFGHGPKDEPWKIEEQFLELMDLCFCVLSPDPLFFLINGYTAGYSPIVYQNNLLPLMQKYGGSVEHGELCIEESKTKRLLPAGIVARWSK